MKRIMIFSKLFIYFIYFLPNLAAKRPITSEEIVSRLECIEYCHRTFHRSCLNPPNLCGDCMHSYYLDEGLCKRKDLQKTYTPSISTIIEPTSEETNENNFLLDQYAPAINNTERGLFLQPQSAFDKYWDIMLIVILSSISLILIVAIISTLVCLCRSQRDQGRDVPYQTFYGDNKGVGTTAVGDRKLAYSAQMYHYQYQKQQMLANEKMNGFDQKNLSGNSTDEEMVDDDDGTVYEYKGPAAVDGELEVTNPYFSETPGQAGCYDSNANRKNFVHH